MIDDTACSQDHPGIGVIGHVNIFHHVTSSASHHGAAWSLQVTYRVVREKLASLFETAWLIKGARLAFFGMQKQGRLRPPWGLFILPVEE
jgi:hypothetical protein